MILGKTEQAWREEFPVLEKLQALEETVWLNLKKQPAAEAAVESPLGLSDVLDAQARLARFAPYIAQAFPETKKAGGLIESPLKEIRKMQNRLCKEQGVSPLGTWLLKCDSHLPISGSIKARGGIYEVLKFAEEVAIKEGGLCFEDDYSILLEERFCRIFSKYSVAVGSTGNLGLSIGIISARLGFCVTVHMSADARQWKKDMLRQKGVIVVEHEGDYSKAVAEGRRQADSDPHCHFVDDENSQDLFLGYAVAALRLQTQLEAQGILVDEEHPLFVYLPCGVGGGPGGVAFGLKLLFGDLVHCFFAEPTHSPCMLLGMATGYHNKLSVTDFGIDNKTAADGLAVGRASGFIGQLIQPFLSGIFTVRDERLFQMLAQLADEEDILLEPSALAGMMGAIHLLSAAGTPYLEAEELCAKMEHTTHIVWATGGSMVPAQEIEAYYQRGKALFNQKNL